jgi:fucose permease
MSEQRRPSSWKAILFIIYGNMVLYGFVQTMRGVIYPLAKSDFDASYSRQGFLVLLVSCMSVLSCALAGLSLHRFGFRKSIGAGFAALMAGMLFFCFIPPGGAAGGFWVVSGTFLLIQAGLGFFEIGLNGMGAKTFTKKSALMMSLLHFFYGMGAITGPLFAGFVADGIGLNWRFVYPAGLVPVAIMAALTFFITPKDETGARPPDISAETPPGMSAAAPRAERFTFRSALKEPMVWRFAVILGLSSAGEVGTINWSGLYLQDVYGYDPKVTGAAFLSLFYILYTASRLFSGFIIEKAGYIRSLLLASAAAITLYALGFLLGRGGIWILPFTGVFLAIIWPTMLAVNISVFRERAQTASSVMLVIAFSLSGVVQFLIGLVNRYAGEAWGYRSCLVYLTIMIILLLRLGRSLKRT